MVCSILGYKCKSPEPADKNGLGIVLWKIICSEGSTLSDAAKRLKIDEDRLSGIVHGRRRISQQEINEGHWREKFFEHYRNTWKKYEADFNQRAGTLPQWKIQMPKPRTKTPPEPEDKGSFGLVLWNILGGEGANMDKAALLLNIDPAYLTAVIQGKLHISREEIERKQWRKKFAAHYPFAWQRHESDFEQCVGVLEESLPWGFSKFPPRLKNAMTSSPQSAAAPAP